MIVLRVTSVNMGISESMHISENMYMFRFCNFEVWPSPFFFFFWWCWVSIFTKYLWQRLIHHEANRAGLLTSLDLWILEVAVNNREIWVEIKDPGFYQEPFLYIHHWYISKSELGYQDSNNLLWFLFLF